MLLAPLFGFTVPLLPGQILWINMITHGLPGVALGADPGSHSAMRRPPVPRGQALVDRTMAKRLPGTPVLEHLIDKRDVVSARRVGERRKRITPSASQR